MVLYHDFNSHSPQWPCEFGAFQEEYDAPLMRRIATALRHSLSTTASSEADMWTPIVARQAAFLDFVKTNQLEEAGRFLGRMFSTPLTYGFHQHEETYKSLRENEGSRQYIRNLYFDKVLALAAALRAIPVQNPEQGDFSPYLQESPDSLLTRIEAKVGREIPAPRFQGGLFALKTERGLFSERDLMAIYVALRIRELFPSPSTRICEIGGGVGYVGYYCSVLGYHDYTIVDLPTVSAVQAYFLAQNIGPEKLILSGESNNKNSPDCVKLLSSNDFLTANTTYDVVVNVDSFPEMNTKVMEGYLRKIQLSTSRLLSINQEAMYFRSRPDVDDIQERVGDVVDKIGDFRRLARFPFWMRKGYVEELYEPMPRLGALKRFVRLFQK